MWKTINYCGQTSSEACTMAVNTITLLITLSDSQRIRKKKLCPNSIVSQGKYSGIRSRKSSFVLDTGTSRTSQNSSQGHIVVTMFHSYPVAGEKNLIDILKHVWIYSISFYRNAWMTVRTKQDLIGPDQWLRCYHLVAIGGFSTRMLRMSEATVRWFDINPKITTLLPPPDAQECFFSLQERWQPVTSFPFHPVRRLLRYEVTSGQTVVRSGAARQLGTTRKHRSGIRCQRDISL